MSEQVILQSGDPGDTEHIGENIGQRLRGGEVIELISDLGGGKTTFTRGVVRGARSKDHVASPTFTVSKVYKTDNFDIHHFDFYRIEDAGLLANELADIIGDSRAVLIIEWGNIIEHVLPEQRMRIEILQQDVMSRELHVAYPATLSYLMDV